MSLSKIKFTCIWQKYKPLKITLCMRDLQLSRYSSIFTKHTLSLADTSVVKDVWDPSQDTFAASQ